MEFQLAFDVSEHGACAKAEEMRLKPRVAKLFFHKRQPFDGLFGRLDSTCRLEADCDSGFLREFANHARHDKADRQCRVDCFFSRGGFDEVRSCHHGDQTRLFDIAQGKQVAGAENHFEVRRATSVFEGDDFVVELLPLRAKNMSASDDYVNFLSARGDRTANFGNAIFKRRESRRKSGRDGGDVDFCALKGATSRFDKEVINADSADMNVQVSDSELLDEFVLKRLTGFRAKAADAFVSVIARKCSEIHARNRAKEPGDLPVFLDRASSDEGGGAALNGTGVNTNAFDPIEIERSAAIRLKRTAGECSDRA